MAEEGKITGGRAGLIEIWTDGSARGNPNGPGGYGAVIRTRDVDGKVVERELSAGFDRTTNNRMELMGAIAALESLKEPSDVVITSDSQYVVKAFNDHWIEGWIRRGWVNSQKEPVKNIELWKRLIEAARPHKIKWVWVRGHNGHIENERCDLLATEAADRDKSELLHDDGGDLRGDQVSLSSPKSDDGDVLTSRDDSMMRTGKDISVQGTGNDMDEKKQTKSIVDIARRLRESAPELAASSEKTRNAALLRLADLLEEKKEEIFAANGLDMKAAEENDIPQAVKKRLKYDEAKLKDSISGLRGLAALPDPLGSIQMNRELDEDLVLKRITVPIGVIGVIFEARPDAMVQVASLCIKSGNCAILKGGKETVNSNRVLFELIKKSVTDAGLPGDSLAQAELHSEIDELLTCDEYVDLLIPRGSNKFVRHIMENTKIPVMGHSSGICHIYIDGAADRNKIIPVVIDAKTSYPAACNAVETLLIKRSIAYEIMPGIYKALTNAGVKVRGSAEAAALIGLLPGGQIEGNEGRSQSACEIMEDEDFATEYTDMVISVRFVEDVKEAVQHINRYGSHHTDAIITEDKEAASYFERMVDSAGVYVNCSTRFSDGFRYGFGAEVGISTGKLHARGPVGLEGLVTYKYILEGNGQIVSDYISGRKKFTHRDI